MILQAPVGLPYQDFRRGHLGWDHIRQHLVLDEPLKAAIYMARMVAADLKAEGTFVGQGNLNYLTHGATCRLLLRMWLDKGAPHSWKNSSPLTKADQERGDELLEQVAAWMTTGSARAARQQSKSLTERQWARHTAEGLWEAALLHRGQNLSPFYEVTRAQLMLRELWTEVAQEAEAKRKKKKISTTDDPPRVGEQGSALHQPANRAANDLRLLQFLSLASLIEPWYPEPDQQLGLIKGGHPLTIMQAYSSTVESFVGEWRDIETDTPLAVVQRCLQNPLVSLGTENGPFLIVDPATNLASWHRLIQAAIDEVQVPVKPKGYVGDDSRSKEMKQVQSHLGKVFEKYLSVVVDGLELLTGEQSVAEFSYVDPHDNRVDTPDHFLSGTGTLVFEAKATQVPNVRRVRLADALGWLDKLAGRNDGRPPLYQGAKFFGEWRQNHPPLTPQLGRFPGFSKARYIIVTPGAIPGFVNWRPFREIWSDSFSVEQQRIEGNTWFMSIHALESYVDIAASMAAKGNKVSLWEDVEEWVKQIGTGRELIRGEAESKPLVLPSFKDFLALKYPAGPRSWPQATDRAG